MCIALKKERAAGPPDVLEKGEKPRSLSPFQQMYHKVLLHFLEGTPSRDDRKSSISLDSSSSSNDDPAGDVDPSVWGMADWMGAPELVTYPRALQ